MVRLSMHWLLPVALWTGAASAAEPPTAPSLRAADPADAQAPVPPLLHVPVLAGYRRHGEAPPIAWLQANDTVTRIGGWRSYAREAAAPGAAAPARKLP